MDQVSPGDLLV